MKNKYIELGILAISLLYVDLFCGAGGTSTGVETAKIHGEKCAKVIACVNHDANAIASHAENHPESLHFTEDIRTLELGPLVEYVGEMKRQYPFAKLVLWASLECTNFSKAKGGLARDADSRTLAEHLDRYIEAISPDSIQIENVEEFMSWGDLDINGKPISKDKGRLYTKWVDHIKGFGYGYDYRILNSADYGALTSRKRFFAQFNRPEFPMVWPEPTHAKNPITGMFESLEKWRPVKEVLDFDDEGISIFGRKKDLVEATLERIYHGLIKFVAGGKDKWILKYNSINGKTRKHIPPSIEDPCPTVSCQGRLGVVSANFLAQYNSGNPEHRVKSVEESCNAVTTNNRFAKVECNFLSKYFSGKPEHKNISVEGPAGTIKTIDSHALVQTQFLSTYYGNGGIHSPEDPSPTVTTKDRLAFIHPKYLVSYNYKDEPKDLDQPCPTVLTKDRFALVGTSFIDQQFGKSKPSSVETVLGALTTNPKYAKVSAEWIMNTNFKNVGSAVEDPAPTITANRKWHYLMDAQYSRIGNDLDQPCFTLIARMDKTPPYLVEISQEGEMQPFIQVEGNVVVYEIYETDSPMLQKIKEFMAHYGLMDIKMRMLKIQELKEIMGFPKDYVLIGTQADQKKFIGNAVEVTMARKICEATAKRLFEHRKAA
ncbi:DNA (cytosine-5)-methyltransferase 1 [Chryseobacterium sp. 52]|uniref:DNA cytosine methyltransferase n=1 Tax=Chryseobacterium sp. 52 TaxID=2035213 RepID=UPI000C190BE8|nr:DNA cytosine methyltransferase [Chryseobacterium sp. 52]PIF44324.1 DNA (cytosine-5)-methyltransferase 1 [Chryseobacterium sp. 52]